MAMGAGHFVIGNQLCVLWVALFGIQVLLNAAETAIASLDASEIDEIVDKEGRLSVFVPLQKPSDSGILATLYALQSLVSSAAAVVFVLVAVSRVMAAHLAPLHHLAKLFRSGKALGQPPILSAITVLAFLTFVLGEFVPRSVGAALPEWVCRRVLPPVNAINGVLCPLRTGWRWATGRCREMLLVLGLPVSRFGGLRFPLPPLQQRVVKEVDAQGDGASGSAFATAELLQSRAIKEVMCPRVDIVAIDKTATVSEFLKVCQETRHHRLPVIDGEIDRIVGVLSVKDLINIDYPHGTEGGERWTPSQASFDNTSVEQLMGVAYVVPETMSVFAVFQEIRKRNLRMVLVADEYGGTAGIVTMEDILEEIMKSEDDQLYASSSSEFKGASEPSQSRRAKSALIYYDESTDCYSIKGNAELEDVCNVLGQQLGAIITEEDFRSFQTLSGFLCNEAGRIPSVGDHILLGKVPYDFHVTASDGRRINEVRVVPRRDEAERHYVGMAKERQRERQPAPQMLLMQT
ncbi:unnamed protein product [Vitrella brassicaformis CCMP3155]|uniref:CBS domain-containing protein n=2 Tax=Vitrella brassicaformis TaxID=1169539 RepID=A0A0G4FSS7_VITBC|nr:unnamed protein product [Vitrella brassicaformis CCMP3155]|eukprot:CEM17757.1 unnamed protein product [Vitrella brassicaformis CCMP3155]